MWVPDYTFSRDSTVKSPDPAFGHEATGAIGMLDMQCEK